MGHTRNKVRKLVTSSQKCRLYIDSKESSKAAKQSSDRIKQNVIKINFSGRGGRDWTGRKTTSRKTHPKAFRLVQSKP